MSGGPYAAWLRVAGRGSSPTCGPLPHIFPSLPLLFCQSSLSLSNKGQKKKLKKKCFLFFWKNKTKKTCLDCHGFKICLNLIRVKQTETVVLNTFSIKWNLWQHLWYVKKIYCLNNTFWCNAKWKSKSWWTKTFVLCPTLNYKSVWIIIIIMWMVAVTFM